MWPLLFLQPKKIEYQNVDEPVPPMRNQTKLYLIWYPVVITILGLTAYLALEKDSKREHISGPATIVSGSSLKIAGRLITFKENIACQLGQPATKDQQVFDCGRWAKDVLQSITKDQPVTCKLYYGSKSRGKIGICYRGNQEKTSLGDEMRKQGAVFPYMGRGRSKGRRDRYASYAQHNKLGIWSFDHVDHPRDWLKTQRSPK